MRVVLIRHGHSPNHDVVAQLNAERQDDYVQDEGMEEDDVEAFVESVERQMEERWLEEREVDPSLSAQGRSEVQDLAAFFGLE